MHLKLTLSKVRPSMRRLLGLAASVTMLGLLGFQAVSALEVPPAPSLERPIVDQTETLSSNQIDELSQRINEGRQKKSYQLGVLIIDSLEGQPIEQYSLQVARQWGVGEEESSNGALLLVALSDRELRIEVGRGLEGDLTDARSRRIIDNVIAPEFKSGDYYQGILMGVTEIERMLQGRPELAATASSSRNTREAISSILPLFLFGFVWLSSVLARSKSWWAGGVIGGVIGLIVSFIAGFALWSVLLTAGLAIGGLVLDYFVSKNYRNHSGRGDSPSWWAGGGGFGGFGGGGGGGFGGGGFGGGGASGRW